MIGSWGPYVFSVSEDRIFAPSGGKFEIEGRWTTHETQGAKPQSEFLGPGIGTFSCDIQLRADFGISPRTVIRQIREDVNKGAYYPLIFGGEPQGDGNWKCTSVSEAWDIVYSGGELFAATISLSLEEYV